MPTTSRSRRLHAPMVNTIVAPKLQKASRAPDVESLLEVIRTHSLNCNSQLTIRRLQNDVAVFGDRVAEIDDYIAFFGDKVAVAGDNLSFRQLSRQCGLCTCLKTFFKLKEWLW